MSAVRPPQKSSWSHVAWLFGAVWVEKKLLFLGLVFTGMLSAAVWLGPRFFAQLIDEGLVQKDRQKFIYYLLAIGLLELLRHGSLFLSQVTYALMGQNVIERSRKNLVEHLFRLPISYFDRNTSGRLMTRIVNDVNSLSDFFQSGFVSILGNAATIAAAFGGLFSVHWGLGFVLLGLFTPVLILCGYFSKKLKRSYENSRNQLSLLNSFLADFLFGMKTIKSLSIEDKKLNQLDQQINQYANAQMQSMHNFALFHPTVSLGIGVLLMFHFWFSLGWVEQGILSAGSWVAVVTYILMLHQPLVEITDRWNFFLVGITGVQRIQEVMLEPPAEAPFKMKPGFKEMELKNVDLEYDSGVRALQEVNWKVRAGERVGIFGESGAGKSTLLQLIYGFYQPTRGTVKWYWNSEIDANSCLGVIEQFPFIFSGTVRENITLFGRFSVDWSQLQNQFKSYTLARELLLNPERYLHERGSNLSMGEKQMLSFLRAFVSRPEVWILDEATAFFHPEAEKEVLQAILEFSSQSTVIQVAHRPHALELMNRWTRVSSGRVEDLPQPS